MIARVEPSAGSECAASCSRPWLPSLPAPEQVQRLSSQDCDAAVAAEFLGPLLTVPTPPQPWSSCVSPWGPPSG